MTPREIIIQNIEFRCKKRIGFNFVNRINRLNDLVEVTCEHKIPEKRWKEGSVEYYTDVWGNVWHRMQNMSRAGEVFQPAIQDWNDLQTYQLPPLDHPDFFKTAQEIGASDTVHFRVGFMPGWPFAICRYMRKMEVYFMDLIAHRNYIDDLHNRVTTLLEGIIDQFGQAGMDGIMFCEDLGTQDRVLIGPKMWNEIFRPLYLRLTQKAHKYGMKVIQHSCGYNWELIDSLCQAGIDCFQFDQPNLYDMPDLARKLRHYRVGLFAPTDIQQVLPGGDRQFIETQTERLVELFREGLIAKDYADLHGIGVRPEWDQWAYDTFVQVGIPFKE